MKRARQSKVMAVLLTTVMTMTMFPAVAFAEEAGTPVELCTITEGCILEVGHEGDCVIEEQTAEEILAGMVAALPSPDDIDPENDTQLEELYNQIHDIRTFAGENGLDVENNEAFNAVIAAAWPAETLSGITTAEEFETALGAGGMVELGSDITIDSKLNIVITKDVVLDLKGYTVTETYGEQNHYFMTVKDGGSLTLTDSVGDGALIAESASHGYGIQLRSNSTFIMNGGLIQTTQESIDIYDSSSNVSITINDGEIISTADSALCLRGSSNVVVEINSGTLTSGSKGSVGVFVSSYQANAIQFNIKGGSIIKEGSGSAIQAYSGSTITISGEALIKTEGYFSAVRVQGGVSAASATTLNVMGGSIISDGGNGVSVEDSAKVNISGGNIAGNGRSASAVYAEESSTVEISGGTLSGTKSAISESSSSQATIKITSGIFSSDVSNYTNGLPVIKDDNGNYIISYLSEVYLDGASGDDAKSGADAANAVKTLDKARLLVSEDGVIYICGQVTVNIDTSLESVAFKRADSYTGKLFSVDGVSLTLSNTTIDGNDVEDTDEYGYLIYTANGATLNINDGVQLINNNATAVYVNHQCTLNMTGGTIKNNSACTGSYPVNGGGIVNCGTTNISDGEISGNSAKNGGGGIDNQRGTVSLTGGTITNNTAQFGAGITTALSAKTVLDGATISNNHASGNGGGVYVSAEWYLPKPASGQAAFEMKSGTITGNTSDGYGGGVYVYAYNSEADFTMTGGSVTNNTYGESYCGGGIFAYGEGATLEIKGGEISGNSCEEPESAMGDAISLHGGYDEDGVYLGLAPVLELSGSPTISGDIYLWDGEEKGPVIQVTDTFTPATPLSVAAYYGTEGTTAIAYANGLTPDVSQFTSVEQEKGLIADKQDAQKLNWTEKYSITFKNEAGKQTYAKIYVMPHSKIDESLVPAMSEIEATTGKKIGFYVAGWRLDGSPTLWDFDNDTAKSSQILLIVWGVKQPDTVSLTADHATVHEGESITLKASATHEADTAAYVYSWYKDGVLLDGKNEATLTVTDSGSYTVKAEAVLEGMTSTALESDPIICTVNAHTFGAEWKSDSSNHWHECACGEKADKAKHSYGDWKVTKAATDDTPGIRERICTVCGYTVTENIATTGTTNTGTNTGSGTNTNKNTNKNTVSVKTGDSSNFAFWIVLLLLSAGGLTGAFVYFRKRKIY